MKKLIKILPIMMTVMMVFMAVSPVLATVGDYTPNPTVPGDAGTQISNVGNNVLGVIRLVGSIIAVGVIMVLGIKYMMGSAQEKAEYKKTFIPYIIGAVLLFAGVQIAGAVVGLAQGW